MGGAVRRYIDILTIIINFPYSTCISSFFGSSIPTSLFIFKMFFRSFMYIQCRSLEMRLNNYSYNYKFPKLTFNKFLTIY